MPDSKITALASIGTGTDPVNDALVIVDVSDVSPGGMSATGTTKRVSLNNLLASSPTATLASATITGDLTVRTDKLAVRSTGVGIGTTTPNASYILDLTTAYDARARQWIADSSFIGSGNLANGFTIRTLSGTTDGIRFLNYAQTTEFMRIDATGLGVGEAPVSGQKLTVNGNGSVRNGNRLYLWDTGNSTAHGIYNSGDNLTFFKNNGTTSMTLDASGNLILLSSNTPATLATNGQLTMNATSNTNLRFSYRGSDGVTRVANLTLA